jgi:spore coat protein U-like protein
MELKRIVVVTMLLLGVAGMAMASGTDTAELTVSASITSNCTISTTALEFGAYDYIEANNSSALNGTGGVSTTCTTGAAVTITLGKGANDTTGTDAVPVRNMKSGENLLAYFLYSDSDRTTVWGNTEGSGVADTGTGAASAKTIYGKVTGGQNKPVGTYTDTVVATVTF